MTAVLIIAGFLVYWLIGLVIVVALNRREGWPNADGDSALALLWPLFALSVALGYVGDFGLKLVTKYVFPPPKG